jgi:multisubunit Na+/H+ antiporter MnhE subunit
MNMNRILYVVLMITMFWILIAASEVFQNIGFRLIAGIILGLHFRIPEFMEESLK